MTFPRFAALVSCIVAATTLTASAADLKSGETLAIQVDKAKTDEEAKVLWARFGGWCAIAEWHPKVRSCTEGMEGDANYRTLALQDGGKIKEKLLEAGPLSYRYAIVESPLPVKNYEAQFSMSANAATPGAVEVSWTAAYDAADGKDKADAQTTIDGILKDGIASIKKKSASMLKTGDGAKQ